MTIQELIAKMFSQQQGASTPQFTGGGSAASAFYGNGDSSNLAQSMLAQPSPPPMNAPGLGEGFGVAVPQLTSYQIGSMVGGGMTPSVTGMDGAPNALQGVGAGQSSLSAFMGKMAPIFKAASKVGGSDAPQPQQLQPPPSYGHFPTETLQGILNRAGYVSPQLAAYYRRMGLVPPGSGQ